MKKLLSLLLTTLLLLGLIGCRQQELPVQTWPPTAETSGVPNPTALPETAVPATDPPERESTQSTQPSETTSPPEATEEPEPTQAMSEPTAPPSKKPAETHPPETVSTDPPVTQPTETEPPETESVETEPPETEPPETEPPETEPLETEPLATEPPSTQPTEPAPTEPAECRHDWFCIHHDEEGHWRAGIACDCGWTVYGEPDELVALWNAHSASYPAVESLFNHGGYGSVDAWIVDKSAYDEWVCRHCGEQKP